MTAQIQWLNDVKYEMHWTWKYLQMWWGSAEAWDGLSSESKHYHLR